MCTLRLSIRSFISGQLKFPSKQHWSSERGLLQNNTSPPVVKLKLWPEGKVCSHEHLASALPGYPSEKKKQNGNKQTSQQAKKVSEAFPRALATQISLEKQALKPKPLYQGRSGGPIENTCLALWGLCR